MRRLGPWRSHCYCLGEGLADTNPSCSENFEQAGLEAAVGLVEAMHCEGLLLAMDFDGSKLDSLKQPRSQRKQVPEEWPNPIGTD